MLAALLLDREREVTDPLVDLLIATMHRVDARAERKVTEELINAFKRVSGKENLLFTIADAAPAAPDGTVREVVFPPRCAAANRSCASWCTSSKPRVRFTGAPSYHAPGNAVVEGRKPIGRANGHGPPMPGDASSRRRGVGGTRHIFVQGAGGPHAGNRKAAAVAL
uniref:hypothetical protein n=1 Tax=Nonomuraea bangladeshensis TaxID=404385 RepID=UPI003F4968C3